MKTHLTKILAFIMTVVIIFSCFTGCKNDDKIVITTGEITTENASTTEKETENTTEIITDTTTEKIIEDSSSTTKKNYNSDKETTTKNSTTTTTEKNKVEFNPTIVYSKNDVYRVYHNIYAFDYKINKVYFTNVESWESWRNIAARMYVEVEIITLYECEVDGNGYSTHEIKKEVSKFDKLAVKDEILFYTNAWYYTSNGEKYDWNNHPYSIARDDFKAGTVLKGDYEFNEEDVENISKIVITEGYEHLWD